MSYRGVGASQLYDCPESNSQDMPPGLSAKYKASFPPRSYTFRKTICGSESPIADECNKSAQPAICYYAKTAPVRADGTVANYLGRPAEQSDWSKWREWTPLRQQDLAPTPQPGISNVMLYGGLVALAAVSAGAIYFATKG